MSIETYLQKLFENAKNPFRWGGQYVKWPDNWVKWDNQDKVTGNEKGTKAQAVVFQDASNMNATDLKDSDLFIETLDLIQYIIYNGINYVLKENSVIKYRFGKSPSIEDIASKISRAGFPDQAEKLKQEYIKQNIKKVDIAPTEELPVKKTQKSGLNVFLVIGLIGAAFLLFKKK